MDAVKPRIEVVPAAKFNMFDEVYFEGDRLTIVGMKLVTALHALAVGLDEWGWFYYLSPIYGASPEEVVGISSWTAQGEDEVHESNLCPVKKRHDD